MNRWKPRLIGLTLAMLVSVGCKQQLFIDRHDYEDAHSLSLRLNAPPDLEQNPSPALQPGAHAPPAPPTVDKPDRPIRYLSLPEAIALALESGNVGSQNQNFPGVPIDSLVSFSGRTVFGSDNIRVFALDPAIAGADIEASLAKFDAKYVSSLTWNKRDDAIANILGNFQNGDQFNLTTGLYKPLPTGGVAGITWSTDYNHLSAPPAGVLNPTWRPRLAFQIEQPLMRDYGVEINQLNFSHAGPLSIQQFRPQSPRVEGVLITRLRYEQSQAEFERVVNHLLLNVEFAYWNLHAAYGALFARDVGLKEAVKTWIVLDKRKEIDVRGSKGNAFRALAQAEFFRAQRVSSLAQVLEAERQLRSLLGLADDGTRLVPADQPTTAPYEPDWAAAVQDTMNRRPELALARQDLKFRQFDMMIQKNQLKPDLRAFASYDINGLGTRLDGPATIAGPLGPQPNNALASFGTNQFNTWQFGLRLDVPIGYRDAHSSVRVARLNMYRSYVQLQDAERKSLLLLRTQYSRLKEYQKLMEMQRAQWEAAANQFRAFAGREDIDAKNENVEAILNAQRTISESITAYFRAQADYNNTLASWQFAKGTILDYDNVNIAEGPLPAAAAVRATEHLRERSAALVLRKRSEGEFLPGAYNIENIPELGSIPMQGTVAPNLQDMWKNAAHTGTPPAGLPEIGPRGAIPPAADNSYTPR